MTMPPCANANVYVLCHIVLCPVSLQLRDQGESA